MLQLTKHLTKMALLTVLAMLPKLASAYDFKVDGLCYNYNDDGTSVTVTYETIHINDYYGYSNLSGSLNIPSTVTYSGTTYSVTTIGNRAFEYSPDLTSVTIPNSVTSIGKGAFNMCRGLTSVTIPNSVTSIGNYAFEDCRGLTSVTIPNSVTSIGEGAFYDCTGLKSVTWNATNCDDFSKDHRPFRSFTDLTNIQSFTFGNEVEHIPSNLCYRLTGLTSVTIGNSVTSIGGNAFFHCYGLTSVTWNATNCDDFSENTRPFDFNNSNVVTLYSNIKTFNFGSTVTKIPACLCVGLSGLTSVTIPNSVTEIGSSAFRYCIGLTSVTIPNSVTSIGGSAFEDCWGLNNIYTALNPDWVQLGLKVFEGVSYNTCNLHVQEKYVNAFKTANQWRDFKNIFGDFIDESAIEEVSIDELDSSLPIDVYNMNGVKVAQSLENLPAGIYIVRQGNKSAKIRK